MAPPTYAADAVAAATKTWAASGQAMLNLAIAATLTLPSRAAHSDPPTTLPGFAFVGHGRCADSNGNTFDMLYSSDDTSWEQCREMAINNAGAILGFSWEYWAVGSSSWGRCYISHNGGGGITETSDTSWLSSTGSATGTVVRSLYTGSDDDDPEYSAGACFRVADCDLVASEMDDADAIHCTLSGMVSAGYGLCVDGNGDDYSVNYKSTVSFAECARDAEPYLTEIVSLNWKSSGSNNCFLGYSAEDGTMPSLSGFSQSSRAGWGAVAGTTPSRNMLCFKPGSLTPTAVPTAAPTSSEPTSAPTVAPTTPLPTTSPTGSPTSSPTLPPTYFPTVSPTVSPTQSPTTITATSTTATATTTTTTATVSTVTITTTSPSGCDDPTWAEETMAEDCTPGDYEYVGRGRCLGGHTAHSGHATGGFATYNLYNLNDIGFTDCAAAAGEQATAGVVGFEWNPMPDYSSPGRCLLLYRGETDSSSRTEVAMGNTSLPSPWVFYENPDETAYTPVPSATAESISQSDYFSKYLGYVILCYRSLATTTTTTTSVTDTTATTTTATTATTTTATTATTITKLTVTRTTGTATTTTRPDCTVDAIEARAVTGYHAEAVKVTPLLNPRRTGFVLKPCDSIGTGVCFSRVSCTGGQPGCLGSRRCAVTDPKCIIFSPCSANLHFVGPRPRRHLTANMPEDNRGLSAFALQDVLPSESSEDSTDSSASSMSWTFGATIAAATATIVLMLAVVVIRRRHRGGGAAATFGLAAPV